MKEPHLTIKEAIIISLIVATGCSLIVRQKEAEPFEIEEVGE